MSYTEDRAFNLQQLSRSRRQKFAWLGILPPDALISPRMAMTLWEVEDAEARGILEDFRDRGWLQGQELADGTQGFFLSDRVGDLARECLIASGEGDGLGFADLAAAQGVLLARYQSQTKGGLWHTLPDDDYIHKHLTWHLEQAGWVEELHELFQEETEWGNNGWFIARECIGQSADFLEDVARGWRLAEDLFEEDPRRAIALQIRYALMTTSVKSLSKNIPAELVAKLVEKGIWTPIQGLNSIKQSDSYLTALQVLIPHLPENLLYRVLTQTIKRLRDESAEATRQDLDFDYELEGLMYVDDEDDEWNCNSWARQDIAFKHLLPYLPKSLFPQILDEIRQFPNESTRARTAIALVLYLPEIALEVLEKVNQLPSDRERVEALINIIPHLSEHSFPQVLELIRQLPKSILEEINLLKVLEICLPEIFSELLDGACQLSNKSERTRALISLAPYLPEHLLSKALNAARELRVQYKKSYALIALAPYLPKIILEALDAACKLQHGYDKAEALSFLAPYLPRELLPEALEASRRLDSYRRVKVLTDLACYFSDIIPEALEAIQQFRRNSSVQTIQAETLTVLAPHLPSHLFLQALEVIDQPSEWNKAKVLEALIPNLPEQFLPLVLETSRQLPNKDGKADVFRVLACQFPEIVPEALEVARKLPNHRDRAYKLRVLASQFPEICPEVLSEIRQLPNQRDRVETVKNLSLCLNKSLLSEALNIARLIPDRFWGIRASSLFTPNQPELFSEVLDEVRRLPNDRDRFDAFISLASYLPATFVPQVLEIASQIHNNRQFDRVRALIAFVPYFPDLIPETLDATGQLDNEDRQVSALRDFAPYLTQEFLPRFLEATFKLSEESQFRVLSALLLYFPEHLILQVLEAPCQLSDESERAKYYAELLPETLEAVRQMVGESERIEMSSLLVSQQTSSLKAIMPNLAQFHNLDSIDRTLWCEILHRLAQHDRKDFLQCLPELIPAIIGLSSTEETLADIAEVVQDIGQQWP
ncbi:MAG: hypothetical protein AAGA60_22275 [Cyanobacteria bacterium P01_E01_bin.42]